MSLLDCSTRAGLLNLCSSVDVPLAEGPVNLNWSQIMKTINDSPFEFFKTGGWGFLAQGDDASNGVCSMLISVRATRLNIDYPVAQSEPESTEESEFEADADDFVESSTDDDSAYDDGDGDGSDGSDAEFNESGTDSGDNWDALEAKAAASDKKKKEAARARGSDESDLDRPKKKNQANGKSRR